MRSFVADSVEYGLQRQVSADVVKATVPLDVSIVRGMSQKKQHEVLYVLSVVLYVHIACIFVCVWCVCTCVRTYVCACVCVFVHVRQHSWYWVPTPTQYRARICRH